MMRKVLISKRCLTMFDKDTLDIFVYISIKYPFVKQISIKSLVSKNEISFLNQKIFIPQLKSTKDGMILIIHEEQFTYIDYVCLMSD